MPSAPAAKITFWACSLSVAFAPQPSDARTSTQYPPAPSDAMPTARVSAMTVAPSLSARYR